jgi:hypothetical protein
MNQFNQRFRQFIMKIFYISICIFFFPFFSSCSKSDSPADYSKPVQYSKGTPVKFKDFDITYMGERRETVPFHNGKEITMVFHDFKITKDNLDKTISWSSGTGDIAPAEFDFNGMKFQLELRYYEKEKKKLDDDEMVVTKTLSP